MTEPILLLLVQSLPLSTMRLKIMIILIRPNGKGTKRSKVIKTIN